MRPLRELQHAFFRGITDAVAGGAEASLAEIQGDARLGAGARLGVYARMYVARLTDVLGEDYPRVAAVLGHETFTTVARRYVVAHPSTQPSLRWFGRHFAAFLARQEGEHSVPAFVPDLARLEWARRDVFDAADADLLDVETLRRIPPDGWAALCLAFVPAVTALESAWAVHRIWDGMERSVWAPEETCVRVWRRDTAVYQAPMDRAEQVAFAHVRAGDDFAALCAGLAAIVGAEAAASTAGAILLRWIEDGMLAAAAAR